MKLFNYRPIFFSLIFFAAGIFTGFLRLKYGFLPVVIIFSVVFLFSFPVIIFNFIKLNNPPFKSIYLFFKNKKIFAVLFIFLLAGYLLFNFATERFNGYAQIEGETAVVSGEITDSYYTDSGGYMLLENTEIKTEGTSLYGEKVFIYVYGNDKLPEQGRCIFSAKVNTNKIFESGKINSYSYRNKIHYNFFVNEGNFVVTEGNPSIFLKVKKHIKSILYTYLRQENAGLCYALVTGDSLIMDNDLKQAFSNTGIAHIFSVSGLHIGVLSVCIIYLLNKLKVKKLYQIFITFFFLLFYAGICDFTPSVLRALVMTTVYLISKAIGIKYDSLSSFSLAAIILLFISPLMLFDAGFILSFCAVLGILLLYGKIKKVFCCFLSEKISSLAAVSLAAQLGILPITSALFNNLPLFSIFLNLLIVPLVSLAYIFLLVLIPLLSVLPFFSILLFIPQGLIEFIKISVMVLSQLSFTSIYINGFGIGTAVFYILILMLSDLIFLKKKLKAVSCLLLSVVFAFFALSNNTTLNYKNTSVSSIGIYKHNSSVLTSNGKCYYIDYGSQKNDINDLKTYFKQNNITGIEAAFFTNYNTAAKYITWFEYLGVKKYIIPYDYKYPNIFAMSEADNKIKYLLSKEVYTYKNIDFSAYFFNGNYYAGAAEVSGKKILYFEDCGEESLQYVYDNFSKKADIVFAENSFNQLNDYFNPSAFVTNSINIYNNANFYNSSIYGSLIFDINNDKIVRKYSYK